MMFSEQNLSVTSHHTQQVSPTCACIDVQHICFLHFVPVPIGHKACESDEALVGELGSASYFTIN